MKKEIKLNWDELSDAEKLQAIGTYAAIRSVEEDRICSMSRARAEAPECRGFYKNPETGYIHVDI